MLLNIAEFVNTVSKLALRAVLARPKLAERLTEFCLVQTLAKVVPRVAIPLVNVAAALCLGVEIGCAVAFVTPFASAACIPTLLRAAGAAVMMGPPLALTLL